MTPCSAAAGSNSIDAGTGNDTVFGGGDADTIIGGAGLDVLNGGDGADYIDGGLDADNLAGVLLVLLVLLVRGVVFCNGGSITSSAHTVASVTRRLDHRVSVLRRTSGARHRDVASNITHLEAAGAG